jgi:hypothetical protein
MAETNCPAGGDRLPLHTITKEFADFTEAETAALRASLKESGLLVPIVIWQSRIVDGRHRERLCRELGIKATYKDITGLCPDEQDMRRYVAGLNQHRRSRTAPLTSAEKRTRIVEALKADAARSDRAIAEKVGVSDKTVASARAKQGAEIPHPTERKSRSGKKGEGQRKTTNKSAASVKKAQVEVDHQKFDQVKFDCDYVLMNILDLRDAIAAVAPETVAAHVGDDEACEELDEVETIRAWLDRYVVPLVERKGKLASSSSEPAETASNISNGAANTATPTPATPEPSTSTRLEWSGLVPCNGSPSDNHSNCSAPAAGGGTYLAMVTRKRDGAFSHYSVSLVGPDGDASKAKHLGSAKALEAAQAIAQQHAEAAAETQK